MKIIVALLALSFSAAASAGVCYQIHSSSNVLVWQGTKPPIQMDKSAIDEEIGKMIPGGHLTIIDDQTTACRPLDKIPKKAPPRSGKRAAKRPG
ncbi:MAG: hypothetical protein LBU46_04250 [Candidatus Accumulibacter sp.]|nr:hypothetical protein [Accumulibacter sp.]